MKWIKIEDRKPQAFRDILFTDGKHAFFGCLERFEEGEDISFWCDSEETWIDGVTHWMPVPKLPTLEAYEAYSKEQDSSPES